ncbi:MAG: hypothetical protein PHH27_02900 [Candidatus Colwellbacteria bacterium]|nr:hypothetical protein [Candidatus Colwellbacteria bacterium]
MKEKYSDGIKTLNDSLNQENLDYYKVLADKIELINNTKNNGNGIEHIKYIISSLRSGRISEAKADCFNQSDKFSVIPEIKEIIKKELFIGDEKHPWYLFEK